MICDYLKDLFKVSNEYTKGIPVEVVTVSFCRTWIDICRPLRNDQNVKKMIRRENFVINVVFNVINFVIHFSPISRSYFLTLFFILP